MSAVYICPGPNNFRFRRSKSITPCSRLKPYTLLTADVHAHIKRN